MNRGGSAGGSSIQLILIIWLSTGLSTCSPIVYGFRYFINCLFVLTDNKIWMNMHIDLFSSQNGDVYSHVLSFHVLSVSSSCGVGTIFILGSM